MPRSVRAAIVSALLLGAPVQATAQQVTIAAASDLQAVMPMVTERYQQQTGRGVRVTYGSSGNFFTQIQNGAPFDLFFSADADYPLRLADAGLADRGSLVVYAVGRLVLWTRTDSGIDVTRGWAALTDARVRRIAIANPAHAPYGRAAVAAMQRNGAYLQVKSKLVLGENISQAAQFVQSGNAQIGILALSIALAPAVKPLGTFWEVPAADYPPLNQTAAILARTAQRTGAREFLEFMKRPEIVRLLTEFGFTAAHDRPSTISRSIDVLIDRRSRNRRS